VETVFGLAGHWFARMVSGLGAGFGENRYFVRCLFMQWMGMSGT